MGDLDRGEAKIIFRQLFDKESSTYSYLLASRETREAILIDPVMDQLERDLTLIRELGLALIFAVDTHVHADHVSSLGKLKVRTGCNTGMSSKGGAKGNTNAFHDNETITLGNLAIKIIETPGHTKGCLSYFCADRVFTGDALLIRGCGRTDFQEGNPEQLHDSITQKIFTLPDSTLVFPAHDYQGFTMSSILEEKTFNPRLTKTKKDFVDFMRALKLAEPKMIRTAVPLNLACGTPL